ncbi:hypothetical protein LV75_003311 [Actinokineospora diospyrosa]|uniref:Uncharacterized protein n=1 Tax=Actinokineospora diospyrosa TaxID=103728 RepID=A0ABT1IE20_9PSEU|nr:hypothetical protein [Actinokineospora diospyrosa]
MVRRWVLALTAAIGVVLVSFAVLVWYLAEQALGPAPEVRTSSPAGMSACGYQPGVTGCDPPELSAGTLALIALLAMGGVGALTAVVVDMVRCRRLRRGHVGVDHD